MTDARPHEVVPIRRETRLASVQGTLALDLQPRQDPPRTSAASGSGPIADVLPIEGLLRRATEEWARRYIQAAVEIVGGDRPVTQLLRWSSREVYQDLQRRALLVARAGRHQPGQGRFQPVRPRVLGVHPSFVTRDVVEVSSHVRYGERSRALAARFERTPDHRWRCTALEFA
ncbi:Rv3235 family protein [Nocardioides sp. URHA0020]|uniref:Rv3235 family protein n=1 Tax=Nocardioides sp. URHA0020 TaxID=1380392 RepID=UPI0004917A7E|nr:Rv3235 family protein [Nocardioides sp. URHA0020]